MSEPARGHLLSVQVAEQWLALEARAVVEILGAQPFIPLPDATAETPGVLSFRGRAVTVLDLAVLAPDVQPARTLIGGSGRPRRRTLVVQEAECLLAMPVDVVREAVEVRAQDLRPRYVTRHRFATEEVELNGLLMPVLALSKVLAALLRGEAP